MSGRGPRRAGVGAAVVGLAAVAILVLVASSGGAPAGGGTSSALGRAAAAAAGTATPPPAPGEARCAPAAVRVSVGRELSPQTGEQSQLFVVTSRSKDSCSLAGYPRVELYAGARRLSFALRDGGTQYFDAPPATVDLRPGARAYFMVAKYRCDGQTIASATLAHVTLPGSRLAVTVRLPDLGETALGFCARYPGDRPLDPGNRVFASRIEPEVQRLFVAPPGS